MRLHSLPFLLRTQSTAPNARNSITSGHHWDCLPFQVNFVCCATSERDAAVDCRLGFLVAREDLAIENVKDVEVLVLGVRIFGSGDSTDPSFFTIYTGDAE